MSLLSPQLEAFMAIVAHKTVHSAATAIHITQTAVTQRIRSLETKLHTTLFVRTRRGMMLTPEGQALLHYCQAVKDLEGETLAKIAGRSLETTIRVSITGPSSIMRSRIIPQCLAVMKQFPNLLVEFAISDFGHRESALRSGDSQFAIIEPENVALEMDSKILKPEQYVLVCSAQWQKRPLKEIIANERIIDFDSNDQMTFNYLKHFDLFELAQHDRHFVNRIESLAMMIASGYGYGLLTKELSESLVRNHELAILNRGKIYEHSVALAWFKRPEPPPYFKALIEAVR